ncbi:DUF3644 domain-containing protein [Weissella confusa]|uniref:DUF3644 domain-containing protein n=1 Tax=Weissella confusa TaxID=1583 RepID=UPI002A74C39A|nr:DUF3644 domain-containing protein [Weissella confusa]MDY2522290.1 DUF3644 domain-containing protein [Weissella confusa]
MSDNKLADQLVTKSVEAFILGLEIYNKPTIRYRIEGFSFFASNAWELMLKAYLIKNEGEESIYYKDKADRTIDLSSVIKRTYTNKKDPLRVNLERVIELRNTSTHFITEDYETVYAPLFQANVINFTRELERKHDVDITDHIAQNFLTLSVSLETISDDQIRAKYSPTMAERFITMRNNVEFQDEQTKSNSRYSIPIEQKFYITKNKNDADFFVAVDRTSDTRLAVAKELRDPSNTHKLSFNNLTTAINDRLEASHVNFKVKRYVNTHQQLRTHFTTGDLQLFIKFYGMKENPLYAYKHIIGQGMQYSYSQAAVDFIYGEIKKAPDTIIERLKNAKK